MADVTLSDLVDEIEAARSHLTALSTACGSQLDQNAAHAGRLLADGYPVDLHDPDVAAGILAAFRIAGESYSWWIRRGAGPGYASTAFHGVMSSIVVHVAALHRDGDRRGAVERVREFAGAYADFSLELLSDDDEIDQLNLSQVELEVERGFRAAGYLEALGDVLDLLEGADR